MSASIPPTISALHLDEVRAAAVQVATQSAASAARDIVAPKTRFVEDEATLRAAFHGPAARAWHPVLTKHGLCFGEGTNPAVFLLSSDKMMPLPGQISQRLAQALGMKTPTSPPPWLEAMQRFGPPPCYPVL